MTRTLRLRRLLSPVVALTGVTLLVAAARSAREDRRRAAALGVTGGGLLAAWVSRQGPPTATDPEAPDVAGREPAGAGEASDGAAAHREPSEVPGRDETDPRGTADEPEVVDDGDDASDVVASDDDVPAPDVDETDDRM